MTNALALRSEPVTRSNATLVWVAFSVSHLWLLILNLSIRPGTYSDVTGVYRFWFDQALRGNVVGVDQDWVYPLLAWLPIAISGAAGTALYGLTWFILVTLLDAVAVWLLLGRNHGVLLAAVYIGLQAMLGPISVGRLDSITVPMVVMAMLAARDRQVFSAGLLLTVAAWIKVWPGVLYLAMLTVRARDWGKRLLLAGLTVSVPTVVIALLLGSGTNVFSFVGEQGARGLQVESVAATPFLWLSARQSAQVYFDDDILTYQVAGPGVDAVAAFMTPLLVIVVVGILVCGWLAARRGAALHELLTYLGLALVTALIVFNKVGSPQFVMWLIPVAICLAATGWQRHAMHLAMIGCICLLTQAVYPWEYAAVLDATGFGLLLVTTRNVLEVLLLVMAGWLLWNNGRVRSEPEAEAIEEPRTQPATQ